MRDLTSGKPFAHILRLSVPLLICVIFGQSALIHSFAAGRYLGEAALSVIGNVTVLTEVFMLFAYGCNVGGSVVVSQLFGGRRHEDMRLAVSTLFIAGAALALLITLLGMIFSDVLLLMVKTPAELVSDSKSYLFVFLSGLIFMYLFNIACGICTALGDSFTPAIYLIASNILNLILDILSAKFTTLGVSGLAWATLISQAAAAVCVVITLKIKLGADSKQRVSFSFTMFSHLMKNIIPAMVHSSVSAVGNVMIQSVINPMGISAIAGCALGSKINNFSGGCIDSIPDGNSVYAAQNIGAARPDRVKSGFRAALACQLVLTGVLMLGVLIFADPLIALFVDHNVSDGSVSIAKTYIISAACIYPLMGVKFLCDDILRAAGRMKLYLLTTVNNLVLRVILVYALAPSLGVASVFIGYCSALAVTAVISIFIYRKNIWMRKLPHTPQ
jgi:putative MATE family efflux protein